MELLDDINTEDQKVALAVQKSIHQIAPLIDVITEKMISGGRLFYIGAGTSEGWVSWMHQNVPQHLEYQKIG